MLLEKCYFTNTQGKAQLLRHRGLVPSGNWAGLLVSGCQSTEVGGSCGSWFIFHIQAVFSNPTWSWVKKGGGQGVPCSRSRHSCGMVHFLIQTSAVPPQKHGQGGRGTIQKFLPPPPCGRTAPRSAAASTSSFHRWSRAAAY